MLSDLEYAQLVTLAALEGKPPATVAHAIVARALRRTRKNGERR